MEALKLFDDRTGPISWDYDDEADVLYLAFGKPRPAVGVDMGDGVIIRFDETAREIVGLTIVGVGGKLEDYIQK